MFSLNTDKIYIKIAGYLLLFLAMLLLQGCKSDKPVLKPESNKVSLTSSSNVVIVNEGIFPFGNASVSFLDSKTGVVSEDIYKTTNGKDLGDVAQSATIINNRLYIVVNNSQKIEVVDKNTFQSVGTISGLVSPRFLLGVGNAKGYVSDIYSNYISVVDLNTFQVTKKIPCSGWTEKMIFHLGKVYVCNYWKSYLYELDPLKDVISDSILIGPGAQSIVADKFDRLIVSCGGYKIPQSESKIIFINPATKKEEKRIPFSTGQPTSLTMNTGGDSIYFLNTAVYKISINDNNVGNPFLNSENRKYYGLGLDPESNTLFVSDAIDYVQKGKVYVYSGSGRELTSFDAGINPGGFCFY